MSAGSFMKVGERKGFVIYCSIEEQSTSWKGTVQVRTSDQDDAEVRHTLTERCGKPTGAFNFGLYLVQQAEQTIDRWP